MKSEVFSIEDLIAFSEYLISLSTQVEFFSNVAHIKEFFTVFLEEKGTDIEVGGRNGHDQRPPDNFFSDENSPAQE
jgi:hypothetical protein